MSPSVCQAAWKAAPFQFWAASLLQHNGMTLVVAQRQLLTTSLFPRRAAKCARCTVSVQFSTFHTAFVFLTGSCDRPQLMSTKALETKAWQLGVRGAPILAAYMA